MIKTDLDLSPIQRTEANYWKSQYLIMCNEVRKANKGIKRLKNKLSKKQVTVNNVRFGRDISGRIYIKQRKSCDLSGVLKFINRSSVPELKMILIEQEKGE